MRRSYNNGSPLLDNLENISVNNESARKAVLDVFNKYGISILPDGRKIEEVVLTR